MRVKVPFSVIYAGGREDVPVIFLPVRDSFGRFVEIPFVIDTGAAFTTIPTALADKEKIPYRTDDAGTASGLVGNVVRYRDAVIVRVACEAYRWPCDFVRTPVGSRATYGVLGRRGFLEAFHFCYGATHFFLSRRGPWHRRALDFLRCPMHREHPAADPL